MTFQILLFLNQIQIILTLIQSQQISKIKYQLQQKIQPKTRILQIYLLTNQIKILLMLMLMLLQLIHPVKIKLQHYQKMLKRIKNLIILS